MSKVSKVLNTIFVILGLLATFFIIYFAMDWAAEAKTTPHRDDSALIFVSIMYYIIFWLVSISNIFAILFQKTKTSIKVLNTFMVTIFSGGFLIGIIMFIGQYALSAEEQGIDISTYTGIVPPEIIDYVSSGLLVIGIITVISLIAFLITPFIVPKRQQELNYENSALSTAQSNVIAPTAIDDQTPISSEVEPTPTTQDDPNPTTTDSNSPFEM